MKKSTLIILVIVCILALLVGVSISRSNRDSDYEYSSVSEREQEESSTTVSKVQQDNKEEHDPDTYVDSAVTSDTGNVAGQDITANYYGPTFLGVQQTANANTVLALFGGYDSNGTMVQMLQICIPLNLTIGQVYDATSDNLNITFSDFSQGMTYSTIGSGYEGEDYFGIAEQNKGNTGELIIDTAQGSILRGRVAATFVSPSPGFTINETEFLIDTSIGYEAPQVESDNEDFFAGSDGGVPAVDANSNPHNQTGRTESTCPICGGIGYSICTTCGGIGTTYNAVKEYDTPCPSCSGTGKEPCVYCGATGIILN